MANHSIPIGDVNMRVKPYPQKRLSVEGTQEYGHHQMMALKAKERKQRFDWSFRSVISKLLLFASIILIVMDWAFGISIPSFFGK